VEALGALGCHCGALPSPGETPAVLSYRKVTCLRWKEQVSFCCSQRGLVHFIPPRNLYSLPSAATLTPRRGDSLFKNPPVPPFQLHSLPLSLPHRFVLFSSLDFVVCPSLFTQLRCQLSLRVFERLLSSLFGRADISHLDLRRSLLLCCPHHVSSL
jgi:hypothetical protein